MVQVVQEPPSRAEAWALQHFGHTWPGHGYRRANEVGLVTLTLALGAQQVLCTAPLLVAASALARRVGGRGLGEGLSRNLGLHGQAAQDVIGLFRSSSRVSLSDLAIGLVLAALFSTGAAATQQRGYELLWSLPRAGLKSWIRQLVWVLGLMLYIFGSLAAARFGRHLPGGESLGIPVRLVDQFVVAFLFYLWSQHLLLTGRVAWRHLLPGATCMALGTSVLISLSAWILPGQITEQVADYGLVGATFVLSLWLVILSGIVLWGALLGAVHYERRNDLDAESAAN